MEQMKMDGLEVIEMNYESPGLPETVRKLKPAVYKDGQSFCCLLGPDPQQGVFGCGKTASEALSDWDLHVKDRAVDHPFGDEIAEFIIARLSGESEETK
jgi:hypothetical protein